MTLTLISDLWEYETTHIFCILICVSQPVTNAVAVALVWSVPRVGNSNELKVETEQNCEHMKAENSRHSPRWLAGRRVATTCRICAFRRWLTKDRAVEQRTARSECRALWRLLPSVRPRNRRTRWLRRRHQLPRWRWPCGGRATPTPSRHVLLAYDAPDASSPASAIPRTEVPEIRTL